MGTNTPDTGSAESSDTVDIHVSCEAFDHVLVLRLCREPDLMILEICLPSFYARQESLFSRWRRRFAIAIAMLRGRDYLLDDIVLSPQSAGALARGLSVYLNEEGQ